MVENYKSIFIYNKKNELVTYVDVTYDNKLIGYYHLDGRELTKVNICRYKEKNKNFTEIKRSKIMFGEDCVLSHMFMDGDSRVVAKKKNSAKLIDPPSVISRVHSYDDQIYEGYTVKDDLVDSWLKKL